MTKDKFYKAQELDHDIRELNTFINPYKKKYIEKTFGCSPSKEMNDFFNMLLENEHNAIYKKASVKLAQLQKEFDKL